MGGRDVQFAIIIDKTLTLHIMSAKKVDKYETLLAVGLDLKDILFSSTASMMMQQIRVFYLILRGTFESYHIILLMGKC